MNKKLILLTVLISTAAGAMENAPIELSPLDTTSEGFGHTLFQLLCKQTNTLDDLCTATKRINARLDDCLDALEQKDRVANS